MDAEDTDATGTPRFGFRRPAPRCGCSAQAGRGQDNLRQDLRGYVLARLGEVRPGACDRRDRGRPSGRALAAMVIGMTQPDVGPERRLYDMMQHLLILAANERRPDVPAARGVITRDDALDAVLQVAAVIDEATQAGHIPGDRGAHGAAMLML